MEALKVLGANVLDCRAPDLRNVSQRVGAIPIDSQTVIGPSQELHRRGV